MAQLVSIHKISQSFAGKNLFNEVSLGIEDGNRVGLIGPNGAGKSTLLKIIARKLTPDSGDVVFKKNLKLGYLEQSPTFLPKDTVLEAILSGAQDRDDALAKAYELIAKFNLSQFGEDFLVSKLSGGWQKKLALARELIKEPELLLLDEPTNHLDVTAIKWLEDFLSEAPFATVIITHDRLFLQRVVNKIFDLDPRNPNYLLSIEGGYLKYLEAKELLLFQQNQREQHLQNQLRRETEWLRRGAIARQTKQKARIERAGDLSDEVEDLSQKNRSRKVLLDFGNDERSPQKLIEADHLSKSYNGISLFKDLNLLITPKTRLALLGDNGCGKSTLIQCLLGKIQPDSGWVNLADRLQVAYFEQNRNTLNYKQSVLKNICPEGDYVSLRGQFVHVRTYLEQFLFPRAQHDLPVEKLSGGEQARLRLAQMMLEPAQVLVLDEPTNDLDVDTLQVLEATLREFQGAVVLVTHDRYFMDQVCDHILYFNREFSTKSNEQHIERFTGYLQWEEWYETQLQIRQQKDREKQQFIQSQTSQQVSSKVPGRRLSYKEKFELENMEPQILEMEARLKDAQESLANPETVSNAAKIQELYLEISKLQSELEHKYNRWAELEEISKK